MARSVPVAVGGLGGSGTRVVADALRAAGFYLGSDLNGALDNLWFTLLFKRFDVLELSTAQFDDLVGLFLNAMRPSRPWSASEREQILSLAREDRLQHSSQWLLGRANSLLSEPSERRERTPRWGWKEPNTHIVIERWFRRLPDLKYVHVMRNGLDMAYSGNQNQVSFWGARVLRSMDAPPTPGDSLRFWCATHRRIFEFGRTNPGRVLVLNFDRLCDDPAVLRTLFEFGGVEPDAAVLELLSQRISAPASIGRFKAYGLGAFDPEDVDYVRSLGFDTVPE